MKMQNEEYKDKAKIFLQRQLDEYTLKIKTLKRKRKLVKSLYIALISISITSNIACATLAGLTIPPLIIPTLSACAGLTTALSLKFNLQDKKQELNKTINQLAKIKRKIDYVVSCNGNFTEAKYHKIIDKLS